jgi:hypothetical protein
MASTHNEYSLELREGGRRNGRLETAKSDCVARTLLLARTFVTTSETSALIHQ